MVLGIITPIGYGLKLFLKILIWNVLTNLIGKHYKIQAMQLKHHNHKKLIFPSRFYSSNTASFHSGNSNIDIIQA